MVKKKKEINIQKVKAIVQIYSLPGESIIEWYTSKTENTMPLVKLLGNAEYPNFVVLDSEYKILYVSGRSKIALTDFLLTLDEELFD